MILENLNDIYIYIYIFFFVVFSGKVETWVNAPSLEHKSMSLKKKN